MSDLPSKETVNPLARHAYTFSEPHLSGYRLVIGFETLEQAQAAHRYLAALAYEQHLRDENDALEDIARG
jgi:hypothetical protein